MAPLPQNSTNRVWIVYTSGGQEHKMLLRFDDGLPSDWATEVNAIIDAMTPMMYDDDAVLGAKFALAGSNLSFPMTGVPAQQGTLIAAPDLEHKPNFVSFTGRSTDGRDWKVSFFSPVFDLSVTGYRDNAPSGDVALLLAAIAAAEPTVTTISGGEPLINTYANYGANAYYQRKQRRTG